MESQKSLKEDWFLWLLIFGALVLTLGYYFLAYSSGPSEESPRWLFAGVDGTSISKLEKHRGDRLAFSVTRKSGDGWQLTRPKGITVDASAVTSWLGSLLNPEVKRRFKASPNADYGFKKNASRIVIFQGNRKHTLHFGGKTPTGQGVYVRYGSAEQAPVFVFPNRVEKELNLSLYDVRDKTLFERSYRELDSVAFETTSDSVTYRQRKKGWVVSPPESTDLNDTESQDFKDNLRTFLTGTASTFYDTSPPQAFEDVRIRIHLGFGKDFKSVRLGGKKETERLLRVEGHPVTGVTRDPIQTFKNLPVKPEGWPEVEEKSTPKTGGSLSQKKLKNLRQRMQQPGTSR